MRSCYKPGKILSLLGGNERRPEDDDAFGKAFQARHESDEKKKRLYYMLVVVIRP